MKKIPCVFQRDFTDQGEAFARPDVTPGCEWVLAGEGVATLKWDGTACLVRGGRLFKRYDAKRGKTPPPAWEPCEPEPDAVTGHHPGWLPVADEPDGLWHREAWASLSVPLADGTYELVGPRLGGNPYRLARHAFKRHGDTVLEAPRAFGDLREFLLALDGEGLVFHRGDGRMAKLRRKDFGFIWPTRSRR